MQSPSHDPNDPGYPPAPGSSAAEVPPPPVEATHGPDQPRLRVSTRSSIWVGLGILLISIGGLIYWLGQRPEPAPAPDTGEPVQATNVRPAKSPDPAPPVAAPAAKPASPASSGLARADSADAVSGLSSSATSKGQLAPEPTDAPNAAKANEQVLALVRNLSVSSAIPGPRGRVTIEGKVRHLGDWVAPGVRLHEVSETEVVFIDDAGATYPRRF